MSTSGWVDPASDGGLPQPGDVVRAKQIDDVIVDLEIQQTELIHAQQELDALTSQISVLQTTNTAQSNTNSILTTNLAALESQVAALQLQVNSLGNGGGSQPGIIDTATPIVGIPYNSTFGSSASSTYSVASGTLPPGLTLDPNSGIISGTPTTLGVYSFAITSTDSVGSVTTPPFSVTVAAQNSNTLPTQAQIGTDYQASFTTSNASTFAISAGALPPGMFLSADGVLSGTPTSAGTYTFVISATDSAGTVSTPTLTISVAQAATPTQRPINTSAPMITGVAIVGQTFKVSAGSWAGAPNSYNYQWNSGSSAIPGATANNYVIQSTDAGKVVSCTVTATNTIGATSVTAAGKAVPIQSGGGTSPAFINDTPSANASVGVAYNYTFTASGSPAPTFTVASGALPTGLALNSTTGSLSGTPNAAGTYTFTIVASNTAGNTITPAITITVATVIAPSFTATTPPAGTQGTPYTYTFGVSGTPTPTLAIANGTLPAGLTLNGYTLSGTPTTAATYSFTLTAANSGGSLTSSTISIVVAAGVSAAPVFTSNSPTAATSGLVYSYQFAASGTPAPVFSVVIAAPTNTAPPVITDATSGNSTVAAGDTLQVTTGTWTGGGALPPGLSLNATTGVLSGTPTTAGTYTFQIAATNSAGVATANIIMTVATASVTLPLLVTAPAITGTLSLGSQLACSAGTWSNAVINPYTSGFEDGGVDNMIAALSANVANSTTNAHNGTHSLKVTSTAAGQMGCRLVTPFTGLVATQTLTISAWVFSTANAARPFIVQIDGQNSSSVLQNQSTSAAVNIAPNTWTQLTLTATVLAGTPQFANLSFYSQSSTLGDIFYIDDINVVEGFAYQWNRSGTTIAGATSPNYTIVSADVNNALTCTVTATNASGATQATTAPVTVASVTDFLDDNFVGSNGSPWNNANWDMSGVLAPANSSIQNNSGQLTTGNTAYASDANARTIITQTDAAAAVTMAPTTFGIEQYGVLALRAFGAWAGSVPANGYLIEVDFLNNQYKLESVSGGGAPNVLAVVTGLPSSIPLRVRLQVQGNTIASRVWDASQTEPTTWDQIATDFTITVPGSAALTAQNGVSGAPSIIQFDNFVYQPPVAITTTPPPVIPPGGTPPPTTGFITRSGSNLLLPNGNRWRYVGFGGYTWFNCGSPVPTVSQINAMFAGLRPGSCFRLHNVRSAWKYGGSTGIDSNHSVPATVDMMVQSAKAHGCYVICVLSDFNNSCDAGDNVNGTWMQAGNHSAWKSWVGNFCQYYSNEPTVAMYEPINEPRGSAIGNATMTSFYSEISGFIKGICPQLVETGMYGSYYSGPVDSQEPGGSNEFKAVNGLSTVDVADVHDYNSTNDPIVNAVGDANNTVGKPMIVGEWNCSYNGWTDNRPGFCNPSFFQTNPSNSTPAVKAILDSFNAVPVLAGVNVWAWDPTVIGTAYEQSVMYASHQI